MSQNEDKDDLEAVSDLADRILKYLSDNETNDDANINVLEAIPALLTVAGCLAFGLPSELRRGAVDFWIEAFRTAALDGTEN